MRLRTMLLICLTALLAASGAAYAQTTGPCPECDEDGEPDDSRYSSVDTGVITEEGGVISDVDQSVGENQHGKFTWFQYCLSFFDILGNYVTFTYEAFVSEDGADIDASLDINGEKVDLEDTVVGEADDATWDAMEPLPLDLPVSHEDLPPGVIIDECLYPEDLDELDVEATVTATCELEA